jgi:hypothetical protein
LREPDQISRPADPAGGREVNVVVAEPTKLPCFRAVEAHDWTFVDSIRESLDKRRFGEIKIGQDAMVWWKLVTQRMDCANGCADLVRTINPD